MSYLVLLSILFLSSHCIAKPIASKERELPKGWHTSGSKPGSYSMGLDENRSPDNSRPATIESVDKLINGFGTLMRNIPADSFRGKKVRMSGFMRSEHVERWAGFWLRIDCAGEERYTADDKRKGEFDNMSNRSVKGTTGWKEYEVVLYVHPTASNIAFGALLNGTGQVWFDKVKLEIVADDVPSTNMR